MAKIDLGKEPAPLRVMADALRDWYDDWVNLFITNSMVVMAWFTIVLGPPATFGLYYVTNRLAHGDSQGPREFLAAAHKYLGKSLLWGGINLLVAALVIVNYVFYQNLQVGWAIIMQALFFFLGVLWLVVQFYALPYFMEQEEKSLKVALRNGLYTILAAPGFTLVVAGVAGLIAALSVGLILPLALAAPCLIACLGNRAVMERLETFGVRERDALR